MKTSIIIFIIVLLVISCTKKDSINLDNLKYNYSSYKSINYDIDLKLKYKSKTDTIKFRTNCTLIRIKTDSIFGGKIWYSVSDTLDYYYDTKHIYVINHKNKKIKKYTSKESWVIGDKLINSYFLKLNSLSNISIKNSKYDINDNKSIKYDNNQLEMIFNNDTLLKLNSLFDYKYDNLYIQKTYLNTSYNLFTEQDLNLKFLKYFNTYKVEVYKPKPIKIKTLSNNTKAPYFRGHLLSNNKDVDFLNYRNKIIILDFWYMSCPPCIETIPYLNKISEKYSKDVIVLGINSKDKSAKEILTDFKQQHKMNYETLFVEKEVDKQYFIKSFPTLYVIDKQGTIIFSKIGFSKDIYKNLDSIITINLQK